MGKRVNTCKGLDAADMTLDPCLKSMCVLGSVGFPLAETNHIKHLFFLGHVGNMWGTSRCQELPGGSESEEDVWLLRSPNSGRAGRSWAELGGAVRDPVSKSEPLKMAVPQSPAVG